MNPNEARSTAFTETLPAALPYLPPKSRPVSKPISSEVDSITVEQAAAGVNRRLSPTRVTIAVFTLGLSIPFVGIRRKNTTRTHDT